ncbi:PD-(D/E)XK nuclease family protein [Polyangium sp. 15x6]|uniref:PD-(D/E)XK nuclease family protein n=1 Tax=Polyangium sp. 15x6 TaxID=3042687 RepID=UPI00249AF4F6|nr:PD-(D/E)XK nuclease family protein [Polyangium sp. 15x6]MDI3287730.1 PD-(D/E)XK nuclease family protein [Polyangium sp. 15x6]
MRAFVQGALAMVEPDCGLASNAVTRLVSRVALEAGPVAGLELPDAPAERVAFADVIDSALGRLRRAGVRPDHLFQAEGPQAALLAEVMRRADEILAQKSLVDPRSAGFVLSRALRRGPCDALLQEMSAYDVTLSGLLAFEADDLSWLEALHARAREAGGRGLVVEMPLLSGDSLFDPTDLDEEAVGGVATVLEKRWAELTFGPSIDWSPLNDGAASLVLRAAGPEGEARAVAAEVLSALGSGVPPESIAILVPALDDATLDPLRAALSDARIPFHEPRGPSPDASPEGRAALGLFALAAGPVTRERVIDILRAPGLHSGIWVSERAERDAEAKAALLAHRLRDVPVEVDRTGTLLVDNLRTVIEAAGDGDEAWMPEALTRMLESVALLAGGKTRAEIAARFGTLCDKLDLGRPSMGELGAALRVEALRGRSLALKAIGEGQAAVRVIRDATRAVVEAAAMLGLEAAPARVEELYAEVRRAGATQGRSDGGGSRASAVRIARPSELCGIRYEVLIVTGLGPGGYGPEADGGLIDERLWSTLPASARPPTSRERDRIRRAELAWAMGGARRVVLAYSTTDDEASPHPTVTRALKAQIAERVEPSSRVSRAASRIDPRGAELVALSAGSLPAPLIADRVSIERARLAFFLDPRADAGPFTGRIDAADPELAAHLRACVGGDMPSRPIAVTHIEKAAGCAFAGFARRVWKTRRQEDALEAADPRERGTQVHAATAAAFQAAWEAGGRANRRKALEAAREAAMRAVGADKEAAPLRRELLIAAVDVALGFVAHGLDEQGFSFALAEQPFGPSGEAPWDALPIAPMPGEGEGDRAPGPSVFVEGKIDRVDRGDGGKSAARVVDYKTGQIPSKSEQGTLHLQLPLYAAAVARATGAEEVQALYLGADKRGEIKASPAKDMDRRAIADKRIDAERTARKVVLSLWDGHIEPRPVKGDLCDRCDARDVCRRPAVVPGEADEEGGG